MRNETLKNLLLTASLISASAFLTACGDSTKDPQKNDPVKEQIEKTEKEVKDVATAEIQVDVAEQNLANERKEAFDSLKKEAQVLDDEVQTQAFLFPALEIGNKNGVLIDTTARKKAKQDFSKTFLPGLKKAEEKILAIVVPQAPSNSNDLIEAIKSSNALLAKDTIIPTTDKAALRKILANYRTDAANQLDVLVTDYKKQTEPDSFAPLDGAAPTADYTRWLATFEPWYNAQVESWNAFMKVCDDRFKTYSDLLKTHNDQIRAVEKFKTEMQARLNAITAKIDNTNDLSAIIIGKLIQKSYFTGKTAEDGEGGRDSIINKIQKSFLDNKDTLLRSSIKLNEFSTTLYNAIKDQVFCSTIPGGTRYSLAEYEVNPGYTGNPIKWKNDIISWIQEILDADADYKLLFKTGAYNTNLSAGFSSTTLRDISSNVSLRQARTAVTGSANLAGFKMNGVAGQSVELGLPLFVQLKGDVSSAKATEATTGSVAYRLGNTVIGAIQGYANSGAGFETDSRQLETSVVASHSFGSFFLEGQVGTVSATEVHNNNWSGYRSQVTLGLDTAFVSPFVQLAHRQLNRGDVVDLNETAAYVGLDMEVAKLAADTYSVDTRLLAKAGYVAKDWSAGAKALGSTTGFTGSVEWSASLSLNSGVAFSSNLALDTTAGSSAGLTVSLDR